MQQQTTVLSTSGSYLSPGVAFSPCHIQQIGAVSLNGLPATPIAPASGESPSGACGWVVRAGAGTGCHMMLFCSPGLHSPPLLGTAAVPGLVAPITNGFAGVVPFPGGHPALETVYANGLVPYPGNSWGPQGLGAWQGGHPWDKHDYALVPREQRGRTKGVPVGQIIAVGTEKEFKHRNFASRRFQVQIPVWAPWVVSLSL